VISSASPQASGDSEIFYQWPSTVAERTQDGAVTMMGLSMDLNAEGWRRNMGRNQIGSVKITSATVLKEGDLWPFNYPAVRIGEDAVIMGWRQAELSLNGDYLVTVELSKKDVAQLFMFLFGDSLDLKDLKQYGLEVAVSDLVAKMLLKKPFGDIVDFVSKYKEKTETPIEMNEISIRSANCLKNEGITTYEKLARMSQAELLRTPNFGRKALNEMKEILLARGLRFADQSSDG
jgi:hypothetical protein